ncbi:hypothetical protein EOD43_06405 [Sphingomonas crocodyli]|uniref:Esterase n=1 Tax=Sphingomonas crocodyli TaxID=1979270 RepID=A0A437MBZ4_9SPHN|nr:hypothetical protein EOD43_06405 [Sphingomonas crocodyli]
MVPVCKVASAGLLTGALMMAAPLSAQKLEEISRPKGPLSLESTGSFFVGGHAAKQNATEIGLYGDGEITVDQMYVQYLIPQKRSGLPVVMVHGGTLTGKSYETTPDGRMGWYEYFARRGFPSYVVDQVGRARSGFNQAPFNAARAGAANPQSQPNLRRVANDVAWVRFRFGPKAGEAFSDSQFPVAAASEFAKQAVPDLGQSFPAYDPNFSALAALAQQLKGAVLMGHSQAGRYPFEAALLAPSGIRALVAIEPPGCKAAEYSDDQITKLARLPILVVYGDHLETPQSQGVSWLPFFQDCEKFVARVNAAKGNAKMLHTSELGIRGNSHMIMQDRNNLQIADLIIKWIREMTRPAR